MLPHRPVRALIGSRAQVTRMMVIFALALAALAIQFGQASADSPHSITLVSGNGAVGANDPLHTVSTDGGLTWSPAYITGQNTTHYAKIAGTDWISCGDTAHGDPTANDDCAIGTTTAGKYTYFRAPFYLPPGASSQSMDISVYSDNAASFSLNGHQIGSQTGYGTCLGGACPATNWGGTADFFSTSNPLHFVTGTNWLLIGLWDSSGIAGLDYKAEVEFNAPHLTLEPASATNVVGDPHALTATFEYDAAPAPGVGVEFEVTSGPNSGVIGTDVTDGAGKATASYTSAVSGVDSIVARTIPATSPITLVSGNGTLKGDDPLNQVSTDGGLTWSQAYITGQNTTHYAKIAGTDWISCGDTAHGDPTANDDCAIGTTTEGKITHFRAPFTLPLGATNPSLDISVYSDNATRFSLNGDVIGSQTGFGTCLGGACPATNWGGTADTFSTSNPLHFNAGLNWLNIELWDSSGIAGLDYKATVSFTPMASIVSNTVSKTWVSPPTADAGGPYTVNEGAAVALSGYGSSDAENDITDYDWDLDNDGLFDDASGVSPTFSAALLDGPGLQPIALRVTDATGLSDTAASSVTIVNVAPELDITGDRTAYYVDWTAADPGAGTASGVITLGDGSTINVTFEAVGDSYHAAQIGPGTQADYWGGAEAAVPGTHISTEVPNLPDTTDILRLEGAIGTTYKVTLTPAIVDPIMLVHSLGNPWGDTARYDFDSPFAIVSQNGNLGQEPGDVLKGDEGNGTLKFLGTYSEFTWTMPAGEFWHGFTFGARTSAALADTVIVDEGEVANNYGTWDDVPADRPDVALSASVGTVTKDSDGPGTWSWSFPTNDGPVQTQIVTITANDQDGGITTESFPLVVNNVAPTIVDTFQVAPIAEGAVSTSGNLVAQATDPAGSNDPLTFLFDCDNNGSYETPANPGTSAADCFFADNGSFTVGVQVSDGDGGVTTGSVIAVVTNRNPGFAFDLGTRSQVIPENGTVTISGTYWDPGTLDTHTGTIDWGEGAPEAVTVTPTGPGTGTWTATHQYLDDNPTGTVADTYFVFVTITDDDGGSKTRKGAVNVRDQAPTIIFDDSVVVISENGTATVSGTYSDVGTLDTHTATINWGEGAPETLVLTPTGPGTGTFSATHQYLDDNPTNTAVDTYKVKVTVKDDDTRQRTQIAYVRVHNVAPVVTLTGATIDENGTATVSGTFLDVGTLDTHTGTINWGDGTTEALTLGAGTFSATHQYLDDNPSGTPSDNYKIAVKIKDDDRRSGKAINTVTVNNVNPVASVTGATINEDGTASVTVTFSDVGSEDTHDVSVDWGEGSPTVVLGAISPVTVTHQYLDDNPSGTASDVYTVTATVTDDDTGVGIATNTVTVNNVDPVITSVSGDTIDENGVATVSGTFSDVGTQDTHGVVINWGDGSSSAATVTQGAGSGSFTATHQYLDDNPTGTSSDTYAITATLTDDDTGSDTAGTSVTVNNLDPVLDGPIDQIAIPVGHTVNLDVDFSDVGTLDTHTATVDWDEGAGPVAASVAEVAGSGTITSSETFDDPGVYVVTVVVTDDDTGSDSLTFIVTVLDIDYKPTSEVDPLELNGNGVVPIAVMGGFRFDVTQLDPSTVLAGYTGKETAPRHEGGHIEDVDGDGYLDYMFHFRQYALGVPLDTPAWTILPIYLTVSNTDGLSFIGEDDVRINPNNDNSKGKGGDDAEDLGAEDAGGDDSGNNGKGKAKGKNK